MDTLRRLFCLFTVSLAASSCGSTPTTITVQGKTLTVAEQSYGKADSSTGATMYCLPLDSRGQFEVILSDFSLCAQVHAKATNQTIFHSSDETNLRLIFPSFLKTDAHGGFMTNTFKVSTTNFCIQNTSGAEAVAFFSHNSGGQATYDVKAQADSGNIAVTGYDGSSGIQGTYDLTFGGDHITGSFNATFCNGLVADYGK